MLFFKKPCHYYLQYASTFVVSTAVTCSITAAYARKEISYIFYLVGAYLNMLRDFRDKLSCRFIESHQVSVVKIHTGLWS
jgi:hypothetical protein